SNYPALAKPGRGTRIELRNNLVGEGEREQSFLLEFVRFRGAGGRACGGSALHGANRSSLQQSAELRYDEGQRSHVGWFFLHPDQFRRVRIVLHHVAKLVLRERIDLVEEADGGFAVAALFALHLKLVSDFAGAEQHASCVRNRVVEDDRLEARLNEVFDGADGFGVTQHALRGEDGERLTPLAHSLATQQVEVLRG